MVAPPPYSAPTPPNPTLNPQRSSARVYTNAGGPLGPLWLPPRYFFESKNLLLGFTGFYLVLLDGSGGDVALEGERVLMGASFVCVAGVLVLNGGDMGGHGGRDSSGQRVSPVSGGSPLSSTGKERDPRPSALAMAGAWTAEPSTRSRWRLTIVFCLMNLGCGRRSARPAQPQPGLGQSARVSARPRRGRAGRRRRRHRRRHPLGHGRVHGVGRRGPGRSPQSGASHRATRDPFISVSLT